MLNLPLLPTSQPVSSQPKTAINSTAPVSPVSEQPRDRAFSDVLRNSEQKTLAAEQDSITIESVTPDEAPVESSAESTVIAGSSAALVSPTDVIGHPETPLMSGTVAISQAATGNPIVRLTSNAPITDIGGNPATPLAPGEASPIQPATDNPAVRLENHAPITDIIDNSTTSLTPETAAIIQPATGNPAFRRAGYTSTIGQSVFFTTDDLSNKNTLLPQGMNNPANFASATSEPLSYINVAADDTANLADGGKYLPLSTPSIHSSPAATTSAPVSAVLGDPAWPEEFGQKITWLATQRLQTAELKLNPAHLGPIEISLKITSEQGVQQLAAQFMSHNPLVREAIEANLPRLREIMAESGIVLTDTSVGADTSRQDAQNRQQSPAYPHSSSGENVNNVDIRHGSGQIATSQANIINTFA